MQAKKSASKKDVEKTNSTGPADGAQFSVLDRIRSITTELDDRMVSLSQKYDEGLSEALEQATSNALGSTVSTLDRFLPTYTKLTKMIFSGLEIELRVYKELSAAEKEHPGTADG